MSEENKGAVSANDQAGSADQLIQTDPANTVIVGESVQNTGAVEEGKVDLDKYIPKEQYEELETKLGTQGNELGEMRTFFDQVSPLLTNLDANPELLQAILDDKITDELIKDVIEGKIPTKEAETVTKAHETVKKELGNKEYEKASPEKIEELISAKLEEGFKGIETKFQKNLNEIEDKRTFEQGVYDFANSKTDFPEYAEAIERWFVDNPNQSDIKVAYNVVKGEVLQKKYEVEEKEKAGEEAKNVAANAGGGESQGTGTLEDKNIVDELIGNVSNPNIF